MAISMTPHTLRPRDGHGALVDALTGQDGDAVTVADDTISAAMGADDVGLWRIAATSACTVRIGPELTDATNGEYWPADWIEVRYLAEGDIVAVDAAA